MIKTGVVEIGGKFHAYFVDTDKHSPIINDFKLIARDKRHEATNDMLALDALFKVVIHCDYCENPIGITASDCLHLCSKCSINS